MIISDANLSDDKNITDSKEKQSNNLCYIYRHIRLDKNEVFYIGKGTNVDGKYARAYSKDRVNPHWHNVVNKHGYVVEIVIENLSEEDAHKKEIELILHYGRIDLGTGTLVNLTEGGDGVSGAIISEETRKKQSDAKKGNTNMLGKKHTDETLKKMSDAHKGNKYCLGYKHTDETRKNMGLSHKGKKQSKEHIEKRTRHNIGHTYNLGRKHTEETRRKRSETLMGNTRSLGTKCTPEQLEKIRKRVGQYDKDGNFLKEYPSLTSVEADGFNRGHVGQCCNGIPRYKTHKGFEWKFL